MMQIIRIDIDITRSIWKNCWMDKPPLKTLTLVVGVSEVSKVSLNAYIVSKIAFVNFLGQLCDSMENELSDVHMQRHYRCNRIR